MDTLDLSSDATARSEAKPAVSRQTAGRIEILASAAGYGFVGIFGKLAFTAGLSVGETLTLRFCVAAALLWTYVLATKPKAVAVPWRKVAICAGLGILGYGVFTTLYFRALEGLSASLTALLLYTYPVIVTAGARLLFGERVSVARWVALPVVAVGLVLLLWGDMAVTNWLAIGLGLCSALFYSAYILTSSRVLRSIDMLAAGTYITTFAAIALFCMAPVSIERAMDVGLSGWGAILGLAFVATAGPLVLFLKGLEKLTNAEASMLSLLEPMIATFAAALLLGERFAPLQFLGAIIILAALVGSGRSSR